MGATTEIAWTDSTWSPMTGCTKLSAGCDNCYAESIAHRFTGTKAWPNGFAVTLHPERLDIPVRWRKPRRIFVCSTGDLFHDQVPDDYIAHVFAVMQSCAAHTFQVLTKRHGRMRSLLSSDDFWEAVTDFGMHVMRQRPSRAQHWADTGQRNHYLPNVWLGVSAENQQWADIRIPVLLDTPAAVRWISAEPLLGPIQLRHMDVEGRGAGMYQINALTGRNTDMGRPCYDVASLDWVVVGGESGPRARPMHPDWARSLRDQCRTAGVPFLFKQWGEYTEATAKLPSDRWLTGDGITHDASWRPDQVGAPAGKWSRHGDVVMRRSGKKAAGRELDGRTWDQYPEAVSVR